MKKLFLIPAAMMLATVLISGSALFKPSPWYTAHFTVGAK